MKAQRHLNDLMQHRVRDVLLVSTLYDAYILQEDGHLTEKVYVEYRELQLSSAPRFWHVGSAEAAFDALETRRFDLVLVVSRVPGMSVSDFARAVQESHPGVAVVLLTFDAAEHAQLGELRQEAALEGIFAWSGEAKILLALSKFVEDARNVDQDIEVADVRVILLVEDSIRFYSSYLSALYPELMMQSQSLFAEGRNRLQKLLRMRTRPKILLAQDFEQACHLSDRYRNNLLALISDVGFPRGGKDDPEAGLALVKRVRARSPDLPVLLQSADSQYREAADALRVQFVKKTSSRLLQKIRGFLRDYMGFGPFIFRTPEGVEIRRARDVEELTTCIAEVPAASVEYHASRNHFSTWLMARSEFDLAAVIKPHRVDDFATVEHLRKATLAEFRRHARLLQSGVITDFAADHFQSDSALQRIGSGSLGGKARGIAFLDKHLSERADLTGGDRLSVRVPESFVLATNAFDEFLAANDLYFVAGSSMSDEQIAGRFLAGRLPEATMGALRTIAANVRYPLAVRSSSLLEDDMLRPFAGVYAAVLLANQAPDVDDRLRDLARAVKLLYASTFYRRARRHLQAMRRRIEEEKMAVLVQRVVGRAHQGLFYPFCSGVAQSQNLYALPPQRASEGAVRLVFGLGPIHSQPAVRFSPAHVNVRPEHRFQSERIAASQRSFRALDLEGGLIVEGAGPRPIVGEHSLDVVTEASLPLAVSHFVPGARALVSTEVGAGERVVTFDGLLQQPEIIPLAQTLRSLLDLAVAGVGMPVEMEFCVDLTVTELDGPRAIIYPLQVRPLVRQGESSTTEQEYLDGECLCRTSRAFGPSPSDPIHDLVVVEAKVFGRELERAAQEIGELNARLEAEGRPYLLIGPGRFGQAERGGVGVSWEQIAGAKVLVEDWSSEAGRPPVGIGFFDRVSQGNVSYLLLPPGSAAAPRPNGPFLHRPLLERQPALFQSASLRHIRFERPLVVRFNETDPGAEILVIPSPDRGEGEQA